MPAEPPSSSHQARGPDARVFLGVLALLGYAIIARGVENLYPFSVFPMYASGESAVTSRIMARTAAGEILEVDRFHGWSCRELPTLDATSCEGVRGIPYIDREREAHVRAHPLGSNDGEGEPVELVRRVFSFDGKARAETCPLAACRASR